MNPAFRTRVTYARDLLGTFPSTQLADSKLTHTNVPILSAAKTRGEFPAYLMGFFENNEKKQGEQGETDQRALLQLYISLDDH
jgi:hypothetical protein